MHAPVSEPFFSELRARFEADSRVRCSLGGLVRLVVSGAPARTYVFDPSVARATSSVAESSSHTESVTDAPCTPHTDDGEQAGESHWLLGDSLTDPEHARGLYDEDTDNEGRKEECTLTASDQTWRDILSGARNPQEAFFRGDLDFRGSTEVALSLSTLFASVRKVAAPL